MSTGLVGNVTQPEVKVNYPCSIRGCRNHADPNDKLLRCYDHCLVEPKRYLNFRNQMREAQGNGVRHNLADEIDLTRALLTGILNTVKPEDPLAIAAATPQAIVALRQVESLVMSNVKLQSFAGQVLDIDQVKYLLEEIVEILVQELPQDSELLTRIADRFQQIDILNKLKAAQ